MYEIDITDTKYSLIQKEIDLKMKVSNLYLKYDPLISLEVKKKNFDKFIKDVEIYYNT